MPNDIFTLIRAGSISFDLKEKVKSFDKRIFRVEDRNKVEIYVLFLAEDPKYLFILCKSPIWSLKEYNSVLLISSRNSGLNQSLANKFENHLGINFNYSIKEKSRNLFLLRMKQNFTRYENNPSYVNLVKMYDHSNFLFN